jgi:cytochrome c oxidase cbb3-type subunit 3/ubiquinol-cytochrome c reductase cytochrome c subunit
MTLRTLPTTLLCLGLSLSSSGCKDAPGKPGPEPEVGRPEQLSSFAPLYRQNCAGCHGANGRGGASISLANPIYLATAGADNIKRITSGGVKGTMMPGFSRQAGGMLTDQQIDILAKGMVETWGRPGAIAGATAPTYQSNSPGNAAQGEKAFATFCARCHGADAAGASLDKTNPAGSLADPAYLALLSDQSLRTTIIAGEPEQNMPDWRSDLTGSGARAMTDQEITDTVAWLAGHRTPTPGQPYRNNQ